MFNVNKFLVVLRANEEGHSVTQFLDQHGRELLYQGELVRLADIKTMVMALHQQYNQTLERDIFQGLSDDPSLHLDYDIRSLADDLRNKQPFYSFIDDPRNPFFERKDNFLKLLLTHPHLAGRYHFVHQGRVIWHPAASLDLLKKIQHSRSLLLVMTHLTYGSPGRVAEILKHTITNIPGSFTRNTVILARCFSFVGAYTKTSRHFNRTKVTPRAPPAFLGHLWIQHLVLVRQVEIEIARALFGEEAAMRYRTYLCPTPNHLLTPEDFSNLLGELTHEHLSTRLTVRPWRQIQTAFSHRHRNPTLVMAKEM